jgi:chromosome condensin MukBEF ATPase and DNA-binding subunit MukB
MNEKKIKELEIANENLDRDIDDLLASQKVTPEQLNVFVDNPTHFSTKNWQELLEEKKRLDEKLQVSLDQIVSPKKTKAKRQSLQTQPHWLFVK